MMKGEVVTPYTGKVLLPEAWVHHAGIDRLSILSDYLVLFLLSCLCSVPEKGYLSSAGK